MTSQTGKVLVWAAVIGAIAIPTIAAAFSPQLAWRGPIYIAAGFAGVAAMAFLLLQPLLIGGYLPGISPIVRRRAHKIVGSLLVLTVVLHVAGLWLTSAPDVIDALMFRSPTQFSAWGVIAMWTVFAAALLAVFRGRLGVRLSVWRYTHTSLAVVTVIGSVVHAMLIEGTMETISKAALCLLTMAVTARLVFDLVKRDRRTNK